MLLPKRLRAIRFVLLLLTVILPALAVAVAASGVTDDIVVPEAERRAELAGRTVAVQVEHALQLGIPLADLVGMDSFLNDVFRETSEVAWLAVTNSQGLVLHRGAASGVGSGPVTGDSLLPPTVGSEALMLPLEVNGESAGDVYLGWRVVASAGPRNAVLTTLLLVLVGGIAVAAECARWIWGMSIGAGVRAVEETLDHVRRGDVCIVPRLAEDDAVGKIARGLSRLLRLVNFRLDEVKALAEDVAATVPAGVRDTVLAQGRLPAEGWALAPEAARIIPPRRQLPLMRFVLFLLAGVLFLHLPGLIAAGGWHGQSGTLIAMAIGFAAALLLMRRPVPGQLPQRPIVVVGAVLIMIVLLGWPVDMTGLPMAAALFLGGGLGLMVQPVRTAARVEGTRIEEIDAEFGGAVVSGAFAGLAVGGLTRMYHLGDIIPLSAAITIGIAAVVLLVALAPVRDDGSRTARWPNIQEAAAVLQRWPLLVLAAGPGLALRLLLAVILIGALSQSAVQGLRGDPLMLTALGTLLAGLWWAGQVGGRAIAQRGQHMAPVLWLVMVVVGVIGLVIPYDDPRAALWGISLVAVMGGAVAPLRHAAAAQTARSAGHGLGGARVEQTIALVEVLGLAMAPLLIGLMGGGAIGALARTLALVVIVAAVPAFSVLGLGRRTPGPAQETQS